MKNISIFCFLMFVCNLLAQTYPADVLDLTNWKITLPIDVDANGKADEIKQPALNSYQHNEYFHLNQTKDGVVFKAHAGGATTSGSGFPRSELREMTNNGEDNASWSSNDGKYHILEIQAKITHYPDVKKHVVVAQIHDADDDIVMLRLETKKLFLEFNGEDGPVLTSDYQLGDIFTFKIEVYNNVMNFYYNGNQFHSQSVSQSFSGAYFKAGMYTQSACQGSKKTTGESCEAYGESEIFGLSVYHGNSLPTDLTEVNHTSFFNAYIQNNVLSIENNFFIGKGLVQLFDIQGRELFSTRLRYKNETIKIPLYSEINSGNYLIVLFSDNQKFSRKVFVP